MRRIIYIMALAFMALHASAQENKEYKASYFGIKSNGKIDNTASLQRAIDFLADKGGGTLVFNVGRFVTGAVNLKSNVHIKLNEGAVIVGADNIYAYKGAKAIFNAVGQENITISGTGVIDGRGPALRAHIREQIDRKHLPEGTEAPALIYFKDCSRVSLVKFIMRHPGSAPQLYIFENSDVKVSGCYTDTPL